MNTSRPIFAAFFLFFIFVSLVIQLHGQAINIEATVDETRWVDSVYNSLSLDERIAQLLVVRANQPNQEYDSRIDEWIRHYNIGGVTFFKGKPETQLLQTNRWQQSSKTPLLVSMDAEWGLAMRLEGTVSYPLQMTLGAVQDNRLIGLMGKQIAEQCQRMGIHMNFAPVVDVNNNPANPVIGMRSFGENPEMVSLKGFAYAHALQRNGIIATAKHFPGHGDTYLDSHYTLPSILHIRKHLEKNELYPFQQLISHELGGVMVAHLYMPAFEKRENLAVSLSENVVTKLLKEEMGFTGLVVTDALDMKGVTNYFPSGQIELKALEAGNDILLLPADVPMAVATIRKAIEDGDLPMQRLEESCRKVLSYKYKVGLHAYRPSFVENLKNDLNRPDYYQLVDRLFEEAITLVKNDNDMLPLQSTDTLSVASLAIGYGKVTDFQLALQDNGLAAVQFHLPRNPTDEEIETMYSRLKDFDLLIVSVQNTNILAGRKFGIDDKSIAFVDRVSKETDVVLNLFASPYALDFFEQLKRIKAIVVSYQDRLDAERISARIITGKASAKGRLPVSVGNHFPFGTGFDTEVLTYIPEKSKPKLENNQRILLRIDSVVMDAIEKKVFPGCQLLAAVEGQIFFNKSYGHHTYDKMRPVQATDVYDVASLTKILATTLAIMKLYEDGRLELTDELGKYFPYLKGTTKENIKLIDILTHQSGFDGWIPFFIETLDENGPKKELYAEHMSMEFPFRVAENMYMARHYKNEIFRLIAASEMKKKEYRYSDMGFYFIPELVELITNQTFEVFLQENFFQPMGLGRMLFRPRYSLSLDEIIPTEKDTIFRRQLLHGDVHDQGAAMLGGISGHAGLFSNAMEVAAIMQMLLNDGSLNGYQYLKPETVNYFNTVHFAKNKNRRGIGFDKPPIDKPKFRTPADAASPQSFGHTGFTGVFAWADPQNELIVVFLSNRVHPDSKNNAISRMNIRTNIHQLFYEAVAKPDELIN
jgi:beta-N-acetylhexosaminidase